MRYHDKYKGRTQNTWAIQDQFFFILERKGIEACG